MATRMGIFACIAALTVLCISPAHCTPSGTFWTPCISDFAPAGKTHLDIDNYFQVGGDQSFPVDIGMEWSTNLSHNLAAEFGVDFINQKDPLFLNAKLGYQEGVLWKSSPALQIGLFNVGTRHRQTDYNICYVVVGKSLADGKTRLHAGGYYGNPGTLRNGDGDPANTGWMAAVDRKLTKDGKWTLYADYASGKNAIGGGGVGVSYSFTKDVSLLAGPVWFNDRELNGDMKWSTQLDVNF